MATDPDRCARELEDGRFCGGRLAIAIRGHRTQHWLRTCTRCFETIHVPAPPIATAPIAWRLAHDLPLTWLPYRDDPPEAER